MPTALLFAPRAIPHLVVAHHHRRPPIMFATISTLHISLRGLHHRMWQFQHQYHSFQRSLWRYTEVNWWLHLKPLHLIGWPPQGPPGSCGEPGRISGLRGGRSGLISTGIPRVSAAFRRAGRALLARHRAPVPLDCMAIATH